MATLTQENYQNKYFHLKYENPKPLSTPDPHQRSARRARKAISISTK